MTTTHKIIKAKDFIRSTPDGEIDFEETKKILIGIAAISKPPADYEILLDFREAHGELRTSKLFELVQVLVRHRDSFRKKIALLIRDDYQFDNATFAKICGQNRGFFIEVFTDFEAAIEWINSNEY